jgi:hypothetical protein
MISLLQMTKMLHKFTGWWFFATPLNNMKISWDDDIPNIWKNRKKVQTTQPVQISGFIEAI